MPPVTVTSMDANNHNNVTVNHKQHAEAHLQLNTVKLIEMQNDDTFYRAMLKLINKIITVLLWHFHRAAC